MYLLPPFKFSMLELIFMKPDIYIMAPEPISTAYFINPSHLSVCVYMYLHIVGRQGVGKNVTTVMNIRATIDKLFDAKFPKRSVSYQKELASSSSQNFLFRIEDVVSVITSCFTVMCNSASDAILWCYWCICVVYLGLLL
jgi:hypothetical protein